MSINNDYTTRDLLMSSYYQYYHRLFGIDLSRKANETIPQQINLAGELEEDNGATMFFIAEKLRKLV